MKELITGKYTIKQIFKDHWASYLLDNKPSEHIVKTVNKMLNCREPSKIGYHKYSCLDHPGEITIVPHSCKSKFCNICGAWQTDKWMAYIWQGKLFQLGPCLRRKSYRLRDLFL